MNSVRRAEAGDMPGLLRLVRRLAAHHGDEATTGVEQLERDLLGPDPWAIGLVADVDGMLAGYAILYRLYRAQSGERGMDLHHLYIEPEQRGAGLGRLLIHEATGVAERAGCSYMTVKAEADNRPAQRFYRSNGFAPSPYSGNRFRLTLGTPSR